MVDQKLFRLANGRKFRIQAISRSSGKTVILKENLTQAQCEQFQPSKWDKQLYVSFRVAFHDSKII